MQYILEMHCHTSESSDCAQVSAAELLYRYSHAGYDGVIITDHFCKSKRNPDGDKSWSQVVNDFFLGYETAKDISSDYGIDVFFGMELRFLTNRNDFLVYGFDKDFLLSHPNLYEMTIEEFYPLAKENNLLVIQAHPFRERCTPVPPSLIDGVEIFNGTFHHESYNFAAEGFCNRRNLIRSSGSDFHFIDDFINGGIILDCKPVDEKEIISLLTDRKHTALFFED